MKRFRRIVALTLAVMLMCSVLCIGASAASYKNKSRTFYIRLSKAWTEVYNLDLHHRYAQYEKIGAVTIKSTSADGKTGTITITDMDTRTGWYNYAAKVTYKYYTEGTTYSYRISNMKDGGKITLTLQSQPAGGTASLTLTGKIHISGSKNFNNIWKIDGLGDGFYFRNT